MLDIILIVIAMGLALFLLRMRLHVDRRRIDIAVPKYLEDRCRKLEEDLERIANEINDVKNMIKKCQTDCSDVDRRGVEK